MNDRISKWSIGWHWPIRFECGREWYDGPHYYLVLGFVAIAYSPWGLR